MAKKAGVAHRNSIVNYNVQQSDVTNKERKIRKHMKNHPNADVHPDKIMNKYIAERRVHLNKKTEKVKIARTKQKDIDRQGR
jgi:hypothetical protein